MDSEAALKTFEMSNSIQTTTDAIYQFNNDEQQQILAQKPWTKETAQHFTLCTHHHTSSHSSVLF